MEKVATRNKLLVTMIWTLVPVSALPLLVFGFLAIDSHYDSLRRQALSGHGALVALMVRALDLSVARVSSLAQKAAEDAHFGTRDLSLIRATLGDWRRLVPEVVTASWIGPDGILLAADPPQPRLVGKPSGNVNLKQLEERDFEISRIYKNDSGEPHYFYVTKVHDSGGKLLGYLGMEVGLNEWTGIARGIIRRQEGMFAAILPQRSLGDPIEVSTAADPLFWPKINAIRSVGLGATERMLVDELHHVTLSDITNLPAQLVVAQPTRFVFDAPRRVVFGYVGAIALLVVSLAVLILLLARRVTEPVRVVSDAARAFSEGRLDARAEVRGRDEIAMLGTSFNKMAENLQVTQHRMRVLYKSIMELFACNDADNILRKTVELACTQCLGEVAWFLPNEVGRSVIYAADSVFIGLHGWVWKNHRSYEITSKEAEGVWRSLDGDRIFAFTMKNQTQELGLIKVAYKSAPDEATVSLLHSLISLVEMALAKQELIRRGAMVATELDLAEAVQGNIMVGSLGVSSSKRVAYHYQPASRLGGDWFFMIEDTVRDKLYVVMGDVTGHGLAQGLVTTAVKGALDVLEMLIRNPEGSIIEGPAAIISFLERVVERVAGRSRLTMTCLAAEVDFGRQVLKLCNAGHTFPILVRDEGGVNKADHLHKNQQPMLGQLTDTAVPHAYVDVEYELQPGDLIVVYTDGLTEAKNLKSRIFGRFLMRTLRKAHEYGSAADLRDEILQMFSYYTQGSHVEDDVCFLVVQVRGHELRQLSA